VDRTSTVGLARTAGWWNTVTVADVNGDRKPDLALGNLGLNSELHASSDRPAKLYVGDFAHAGGPGDTQAILATYDGKDSYPFAGRDELLEALPQLRAKYPTYSSFGGARIEDVLTASERRNARVLEATTLASMVALNDGKGGFALRPLPAEAQVAPIYAALAGDLDGDGRTDLLLGGNQYGMAPGLGRTDASYGLLLRGVGGGNFAPVEMQESGVAIDGQVRHMAVARTARGHVIVVARNNDTLLVLALRR
jgi:hypothetical protein